MENESLMPTIAEIAWDNLQVTIRIEKLLESMNINLKAINLELSDMRKLKQNNS